MPLTKNFSSSRYFSPALPLPVETIRGQAMLEIQGRFRAAVAGSIAGAILLYLIFFFTAWLNDTALDAVLAMFICVLGAIGGWLAGLGYEIHQVIREQREKAYRTLIEYAPDGIGLCQEERLIWLNPVACRLFGVTSSRQFQHKTLSEFVAPENHTLLAGYTEQIHQGIHLPAWIGVELKRPDATRMEVRLHLAVLENYPGARLMLGAAEGYPELREVQDRMYDHLAQEIEVALRGRGLELPAAQMRALCRSMPEVFDRLVLVVHKAEGEQTNALVAEMKRWVFGHLSRYLD